MAYQYMPQKPESVRNPYSALGMLGVAVNRQSRGYKAWVQSALNEIMGQRLKVDGIMGPKTRRVIRSFQQERGLKIDGIVGPKTEAALRAAGAPPLPWEERTAPVEGTLGALVSMPGCAGLSGVKLRVFGFELWLNSCQADSLGRSATATGGIGTTICGGLALAWPPGAPACAAVFGVLVAYQGVIAAVNAWSGSRGVKVFFLAPSPVGLVPFVPQPFAVFPQ